MADWLKLYELALAIIDEAEKSCGKFRWTIGGGTMLDDMFAHRQSKDIDIFVADPQILLYLSPRVNAIAEQIAGDSYTEASNAIKIIVGEGEIDFIVAPRLTEPGAVTRTIKDHPVLVETPAEILAKKVFYRDKDFTARDIFDLAFLIEKGEAAFLQQSQYRAKLAVIQQRMNRHDTALRKAYASIVQTGYTVDYDHCMKVIKHFIATLP